MLAADQLCNEHGSKNSIAENASKHPTVPNNRPKYMSRQFILKIKPVVVLGNSSWDICDRR